MPHSERPSRSKAPPRPRQSPFPAYSSRRAQRVKKSGQGAQAQSILQCLLRLLLVPQRRSERPGKTTPHPQVLAATPARRRPAPLHTVRATSERCPGTETGYADQAPGCADACSARYAKARVWEQEAPCRYWPRSPGAPVVRFELEISKAPVQRGRSLQGGEFDGCGRSLHSATIRLETHRNDAPPIGSAGPRLRDALPVGEHSLIIQVGQAGPGHGIGQKIPRAMRQSHPTMACTREAGGQPGTIHEAGPSTDRSPTPRFPDCTAAASLLQASAPRPTTPTRRAARALDRGTGRRARGSGASPS